MTQEYLNSFISENDRNALIQFNGSEVMKEAVRKILLGTVYANGTLRKDLPADATRNSAFLLVSQGKFSTETVGHDLQVLWEAVQIVENAFDDIGKFLPEQKVVEKKNNAR